MRTRGRKGPHHHAQTGATPLDIVNTCPRLDAATTLRVNAWRYLLGRDFETVRRAARLEPRGRPQARRYPLGPDRSSNESRRYSRADPDPLPILPPPPLFCPLMSKQRARFSRRRSIVLPVLFGNPSPAMTSSHSFANSSTISDGSPSYAGASVSHSNPVDITRSHTVGHELRRPPSSFKKTTSAPVCLG